MQDPEEAAASAAEEQDEAEARKKAQAQLESQDDLAYITSGERSPQEAEKQVRTPAPRRQPAKAKDARG